jgi:hypothetical protein
LDICHSVFLVSSDSDFYIFRDGRHTASGERLLQAMRASLKAAADERGWMDALLRSGELECALADASVSEAELLSRVTDRCAEILVSSEFRERPELLHLLPLKIHRELTRSTPEGFAYYALHPLRYADVVEGLDEIRDAVVVGIRSIGTTLSAVTAAALRQRGSNVQRFSVRPEGHPFDRVTRWSDAQMQLIRYGVLSEAMFLVVDEGPGLSGSSFLSVAEGLCEAGVAQDRIVLIPGYVPDASRLRAQDAARRWAKFRCLAIGDGRRPQGEWIGAGEWRQQFLGESRWPGSWTNMERAKFLSHDGRVIWKFEGLGQYGDRAREEAEALATAGFGAKVVADAYGFVGYECLRGRPAAKQELSPERIRRIAEYCAFRAAKFHRQLTTAQQDDFATMVRVNFEREFGNRLDDALTEFKFVTPITCDAKMAPHEWFLDENGQFLKLDATAHGDDHFFPGPCDVAWDLAGAIVEWGIGAEARDRLLHEYHALSGDHATGRIENYLLAYSVFRFAWCKMAAAAMIGTADGERLLRDYRRYRGYAERIAAISAGG